MARPNGRPNTDPTPDRTVHTIAEAADRLGITSEAVRMRLKRATLAGEKRGRHWVVFLDEATQHPPPGDHTAPEHPSQQPTERDRTADQTTDPTALVAVYEQLVASQREEIAFLRRELETRTDELQRRDVLLREALQRVPQLTAGEDARSQYTGPIDSARPEPVREASRGTETSSRPWWRFWGRR